MEAAGLRPWREVVAPRPEVRGGRYRQAEFAADLAQVAAGRASAEYQDAAEFFSRTFLTEGLRGLLAAAVRRLGGGDGEPVIQLRTAFGGGKTHALLALYHLCGGAAGPEELPGIPELLRSAGASALPRARTAVLAGTDLSPAQPWPCPALGGRPVRTLWGELAAQLGGVEAYEAFRPADEVGVPPGASELVRLLESRGPALILVDELVAFARALHGRDGLPAGSFDANLTFVQSLTEAVRRCPAALLVLTVPAGDTEQGGPAGKAAMQRLEATLGRVEAVWRPVAGSEGFKIVRRRLFQPVGDEAARDAACRAFGRMYAERAADFPPEAREAGYLLRLRAAYPIHPELFDRLYDDWSTLERFQRTRGVLRLMAAVVGELWARKDAGTIILPGSLPLDAPVVREELTRHLEEGWNGLVDAEVDGPAAEPCRIDRENPRLGRAGGARRVARAIFLGSAPPVPERPARGVAHARVRLGVVQPGESPGLFDDALTRLRDHLAHLHGDGRRLWYDTQPNLLHAARERAGRLEPWQVDEEVRRRLRTRDRGDFAAVQVHEPGGDVPDEPAARLVVLPFREAHRGGGGPSSADPSPALALAGRILDRRAGGRRQHRNMLLFLAAEEAATAALEEAVRQYLAWRSIVADADRAALEVDAFSLRSARDEARRAEGALDHRLQDAFCWLLAPSQDGPQAVGWDAVRIGGTDPYVARATRAARGDELLITRWSPALLRRELDRWLWVDSPHVELRRVWDSLATYCYLPRLRDADVLAAAVAEGARDRAFFAYAAAATDDGGYVDLRFGDPRGADVRIDSAAVLVRPEVALRHLAEEAGEAREGGAASPAPVLRRFSGSVALDVLHAEADLRRVVAELLQHVGGLPGAEISITLDISARLPAGFPPDIVRVLKENSRALRFRSASFEEG